MGADEDCLWPGRARPRGLGLGGEGRDGDGMVVGRMEAGAVSPSASSSPNKESPVPEIAEAASAISAPPSGFCSDKSSASLSPEDSLPFSPSCFEFSVSFFSKKSGPIDIDIFVAGPSFPSSSSSLRACGRGEGVGEEGNPTGRRDTEESCALWDGYVRTV